MSDLRGCIRVYGWIAIVFAVVAFVVLVVNRCQAPSANDASDDFFPGDAQDEGYPNRREA